MSRRIGIWIFIMQRQKVGILPTVQWDLKTKQMLVPQCAVAMALFFFAAACNSWR